jgi:Tfp pilus assembly protein PilX
MQTVIKRLSSLQSRRGSALVGVVAISILMGIAAVGYLSVSGSSVNHEAAALDDAKALNAAESGLFIGTCWLSDQQNWNLIQANAAGIVAHVYSGSLRGMDISVEVIRGTAVDTVCSVASDPRAPQLRNLSYKKQLTWTATTTPAPNTSTIIDKILTGGKGGSNNNDGFTNMKFDGPLHSNMPIVLSQGSKPGTPSEVRFVNGKVTVHNKTDLLPFNLKDPFNEANDPNYAHYGHYGTNYYNNYDFGVCQHNSNTNAADLDKNFSSVYVHSQDSLYLDIAYGTEDANFKAAQAQAISDPNPKHAGMIETLVFSGSSADYYYYDKTLKNWNMVTVPNLGGALLVSDHDINIYGSLSTNTTLITRPGSNADISIVGEITNTGFAPDNAKINDLDNSSNYGLSGNALLTVISDDQIKMLDSWKSPPNWTIGSGWHHTDANSTLLANSTILEDGKMRVNKDGQPYPDFYVNGVFISKNQMVMNSANHGNELRMLGSRSIGEYARDTWQSGGSFHSKLLYDKRLMGALAPAGVTINVMTSGPGGNARLVLNLSAWKEKNIPL